MARICIAEMIGEQRLTMSDFHSCNFLLFSSVNSGLLAANTCAIKLAGVITLMGASTCENFLCFTITRRIDADCRKRIF